MPQLKGAIIKGADHIAAMAQPHDVNERIIRFLQRGPTAGNPAGEDWGALCAADFSDVLRHVSTWSLWNLEDFRAPCPVSAYHRDWAQLPPPILFSPCASLRP
jgi:hypothetical protein